MLLWSANNSLARADKPYKAEAEEATIIAVEAMATK